VRQGRKVAGWEMAVTSQQWSLCMRNYEIKYQTERCVCSKQTSDNYILIDLVGSRLYADRISERRRRLEHV
jgi:hypothetical protein